MKKSRMGFLCAQGWEEALAGELSHLNSESAPVSIGPGLVVCDNVTQLARFEPVFAQQWLPNPVEISGESIKNFVQEMGNYVDSFIDPTPLPWTFITFTPDLFTEDSIRYQKIGSRATLLGKAFLERMSKFRRRAMERYQPWEDVEEKRPILVIQGVLTTTSKMWMSAGETFRIPPNRIAPVLWKHSAGQVPHDPDAPCRSYYKLEEALKQAGTTIKPDETCVDLGAAPGGWTWSALKRGAKVIAIDAADLKPRVENHPFCQHLRDNGYAFMPEKPVDWMFCDMIVRPMATLGLLERWLEAGACKKFVVNVKFRGKDPSTILQSIENLREKWKLSRLSVRHLFHDRNEITLVGSR